jgi:hypothetical protein
MISVETSETGIRVTIPKGEVPPERLDSFLDWLRLEAIAGRSALTETEAGRIAEEGKTAWWTANKTRLIPSEKS